MATLPKIEGFYLDFSNDVPMYIVVAADAFNGLRCVVGPFLDYDEAERYMESHNIGHVTTAVCRLSPPTKRSCDLLPALPAK